MNKTEEVQFCSDIIADVLKHGGLMDGVIVGELFRYRTRMRICTKGYLFNANPSGVRILPVGGWLVVAAAPQ